MKKEILFQLDIAWQLFEYHCHNLSEEEAMWCKTNQGLQIRKIVQAKKQKIKTGDGINTPDIRCYSLVYVDPNYAGSIKEMSERPFYDNWRIWSEDMWSG